MTRPSGSVGQPVIECSVVLPCLNESDTVATCVDAAWQALVSHGISGEVIVADNGSTDDSPGLAAAAGARVVSVVQRGYGSALIGGITAAKGRFVVMADADLSYDLSFVPAFVAKLRDGHDLVQGCRLSSGGGQVMPGAMPLLHRYVGNPLFSLMARWWFRAPIHDIHCGMRGFTKELFQRLDQRCTGMEFASEMVIKASLANARIAEVPITLRPDGRRAHAPHLRTFRDGWRHLRFFLLFSPRWLFLVPGIVLGLLSMIGYAIAMPRLTISGITFDVHTLLFASLALICGVQAIVFALMTKVFAIAEGLLPSDERLTRLFRVATLERGLLLGFVTIALGLIFLVVAVNQWRQRDFGDLDYAQTMRWVIPGMTLTVLGFQGILSSFFFSILGMHRR
ncbi:MAG: glycosyltransferase family 2 protein [Gemmatimonadales bacterium]|nr:glycosyltransferase family 2 protein [Gemmatimonadales bacterium]